MSSEPALTIREVTVLFDGHPAVAGLDLDLAEGSITAVVGPSGCGKSTLLRAVGGLLPLDAGVVSWKGTDLVSTPPHERGFGLMFQEHALFAHRSVSENIEFGLRMQKQPAARRRARVQDILDLLDMAGFEDRAIGTLSGGEAQRVALGRALAPEPRLLMLDEPLAALDRGLSERLAGEVRTILNTVGTTALYVTHDQHEAFSVADRLAIMWDGRIRAAGEPRTLREDPGDERTARFLGLTNIYAVAGVHEGGVATAWGTIPRPAQGNAKSQILVRPEAVELVGDGDAVVVSSVYRGELSEILLQLPDGAQMRVLRLEAPPVGSRWGVHVNAGGTAWIAA